MEALMRVHSSSSHSRMKDRKRPFLTIQAKTPIFKPYKVQR
jgi:hypothetical protein